MTLKKEDFTDEQWAEIQAEGEQCERHQPGGDQAAPACGLDAGPCVSEQCR